MNKVLFLRLVSDRNEDIMGMIIGIICWALATYQEKCLRQSSTGGPLDELMWYSLVLQLCFQMRRLKLGEIKRFPRSTS